MVSGEDQKPQKPVVSSTLTRILHVNSFACSALLRSLELDCADLALIRLNRFADETVLMRGKRGQCKTHELVKVRRQ